MRKALVIRTIGDPEIVGAIVDGMNRKIIPLDSEELAAVKAENLRLKNRNGVRQSADDKRWEAQRHDLAVKYGSRVHSAAYQNALLWWTLTSLLIVECCRRLVMMVRGYR